MKAVTIVWDRDDPNRRRTCFWESLIDKYQKRSTITQCEFKFLSISDLLERGHLALQLFDKNTNDVIVLNWDVINTDPVYGSDRAHDFFHHYVPDLHKWVRQGGVVIVEEQGASSRLVQSAYDPFVYDIESMTKRYGVTVLCREATSKQDVYPNARKASHPLLSGIHGSLSLDQAVLYRRDWFPSQYVEGVPSLKEYNTYKSRLYAGWFTSWKGWDPLILADRDFHITLRSEPPFVKIARRPVVLCRLVEGSGGAVGAYVLTTLYLASSELVQLIENAFMLADNAPAYLAPLAGPARKVRWTLTATSGISGLLVGLLVTNLIDFPTVVSAVATLGGGIIAGYLANALYGRTR